MFIIIGLVIVLGCVFGVYIVTGGNMEIVLHALPHELATIFGAAIGAFVVSNSKEVLKGAGKGLARAFKGEKWKRDDYRDLLCLMFLIVKTLRTKGVVAVEAHIEKPEDSKLFQAFPRIAADHHLLEFICDYVRMMTMNFEDPNQMADAMEADLEKHHEEEAQVQHALATMGDALPAIGIVAAVLGVVKTMGSIDQPTDVLGAMIGSALVGTFLGVLLSYTVVGPIATRLGQVIDAEGKFIGLVRTVIVSHLQGQAPQVAVDIARRSTPSIHAPSFNELEEAINALPNDLV